MHLLQQSLPSNDVLELIYLGEARGGKEEEADGAEEGETERKRGRWRGQRRAVEGNGPGKQREERQWGREIEKQQYVE